MNELDAEQLLKHDHEMSVHLVNRYYMLRHHKKLKSNPKMECILVLNSNVGEQIRFLKYYASRIILQEPLPENLEAAIKRKRTGDIDEIKRILRTLMRFF